jgi:hypothetical protein
VSSKNNVTSVHFHQEEKITWRKQPEIKEIETFYKESIVNDTLKRILYFIREEITEKVNTKLVSVMNEEIYLECPKEKIEDIKEKFVKIIYKSWSEYHFPNPIIPEIKIVKSWNEVNENKNKKEI